jgi:hypothetical protein
MSMVPHLPDFSMIAGDEPENQCREVPPRSLNFSALPGPDKP